MISILMFDRHHVATSACVWKWKWRAWVYRWQVSAEQLSCFVVHWHVAVLASTVMLVFAGNPYDIVGGDPLMVELLVRPVSGDVQFCGFMSVPGGEVLVAVSLLRCIMAVCCQRNPGLMFPLVFRGRRLIVLRIVSVNGEMGGWSLGSG